RSRRSQDRAGGRAAQEQALGISVDDCLSPGLHRLPDLPHDLGAVLGARSPDRIRRVRCLADVPGIPEAAPPAGCIAWSCPKASSSLAALSVSRRSRPKARWRLSPGTCTGPPEIPTRVLERHTLGPTPAPIVDVV